MRSSRSAPDPLDPGPQGFAHRGLHGPGVPENSLAAFDAAAAIGAGIECDLRLTADHVPIVFHDRDTQRLCGDALVCSQSHWDQLRTLRLDNTDQTIPSLADLLCRVDGRVPLILELKDERNAARFAGALVPILQEYRGPVGVMSFAAGVAAWFATHAPDIRRGLVLSGRDVTLRRAAKLRRADPDFLAVKVTQLDKPWVHAESAERPIYSWTVRSDKDRLRVERWADAAIWEGDGRPRT